ncbi:MAG: phosphoglycerate dehydrogenase [Christensenellales bacterium]
MKRGLSVKILVSATSFANRLDSPAGKKLRSFAEEVVVNPYGRPMQPDEILPVLQGVDGYIAGLDFITKEVIEKAPATLKAISRYGVGYERVDVAAAKRKGITVTNTPGANTQAVADLTFGLLLCACRNICVLNQQVKDGRWPRRYGVELYGKTLGILGFGSVGKAVAQRAAGFSMKTLAYDPFVSAETAAAHGCELVELSSLFKQSDFITLHLPVTDQTRNLINAAAIDSMKQGAVLINTARGGLIDEAAAYQALLNGKLGGLGLDAFSTEPPQDNPLLRLPNVIATPHTGAHTTEAMDSMAMMSVDNLIAVLSGQPCPFVVS